MDEEVSNKKDYTKIRLIILLIILLVMILCFNIFYANNNNNEEEELDRMLRVSFYLGPEIMQAFILNDATDEEIEKIGKQIKEIPGVDTITFVSREEAYNQMKDRFKDEEELFEGIEQEIFSPSYIVTVTDLSEYRRVQDSIYEIDHIKKVTSGNYKMGWINITENELKELLVDDFHNMNPYAKIQYLMEKDINIEWEEYID